MSRLNRRVEKLETKNRQDPEEVWVQYVIEEAAGEAAEAEAQAAAIAEWEKENGPLGDRQVNFIAMRLIAPKGR
jgi:hypothetical protein